MSFLDNCLKCSREIFDILNSNRDDLFEPQGIGFGGDESLKIDLIAEEIFIKELSVYGNIFSEESGFIDNNKNKTLVIDPIDGSSNISNGVPYYGSCVALKNEQEVEKSFIINLANGDYFYRDQNGKIANNLFYERIHHKKYKSNMVIFEKAYANANIVNKLHDNDIKFRGLGALALSIAYANRVKGVIFIDKIREFDVEAALHFNKNLNIKIGKDYLIIAKDKEDFDKISEIISKG